MSRRLWLALAIWLVATAAAAALFTYGDRYPDRMGIVVGGLVILGGVMLLLSRWWVLRPYAELFGPSGAMPRGLRSAFAWIVAVYGVVNSYAMSLALGPSSDPVVVFIWWMIFLLVPPVAWLALRTRVLQAPT